MTDLLPPRLRNAVQMFGVILFLLFLLSACSHSTPPRLNQPASNAAATVASSQVSDRTVKTEAGLLEGVISRNVLSFKGIPFAAPPIGSLRWRAPQPAVPWTGVRKATEFGHECMQQTETTAGHSADSVPSEDCLVLNVWLPAGLEPGEQLPVMVWIHGGAYVNGGTSTPLYDGSAFARQRLVFVSLNYRLGRFGFFAHPALLAAHEGPVGNFSFMDQIVALQWVKRNIAAFGGNPDQITLFGQSAGGDAVMHLLTSPQAKDLFNRAIVMSGGGRSPLLGGNDLTKGTSQSPSAEQIGLNFARQAGVTGTGPDALSALRALPAATVLGTLDIPELANSTSAFPTYVNGSIVDGEIVQGSPEAMLRKGQAAHVPMIVGTTCQDLPVKFPRSKAHPLSFFGSNATKARAAYSADGAFTADEIYAAIGGDMTMQEPARFVAKQMTRAGMRIWLYRFCYVAESLRKKVRGASHGSELPFVFDTLVFLYGEAVTSNDRAAARALNMYFANFAKSGDPNGTDMPTWPAFDPARTELMLFTLDNGPVMVPDPLKPRLELIERVADGNR
jgi:para-nitrobenzyl esterase